MGRWVLVAKVVGPNQQFARSLVSRVRPKLETVIIQSIVSPHNRTWPGLTDPSEYASSWFPENERICIARPVVGIWMIWVVFVVIAVAIDSRIALLSNVASCLAIEASRGVDHVETTCDARMALIESAASKEINCIVRV